MDLSKLNAVQSMASKVEALEFVTIAYAVGGTMGASENPALEEPDPDEERWYIRFGSADTGIGPMIKAEADALVTKLNTAMQPVKDEFLAKAKDKIRDLVA